MADERRIDIQRRLERELAECEAALVSNPNDANEWAKKGSNLSLLNRLEEAKAAYEKAIELDVFYETSLVYRSVLERLGQTEKVAELQKKAIEAKRKKCEEDLRQCDMRLAYDPDNAFEHASRAEALQGLRKFDEGLEACDRAIELDPNLSNAYSARSCIYQCMGDKLAALENAKEAMKLEPCSYFVRLYRGMLEELARWPEALAICDVETKVCNGDDAELKRTKSDRSRILKQLSLLPEETHEDRGGRLPQNVLSALAAENPPLHPKVLTLHYLSHFGSFDRLTTWLQQQEESEQLREWINTPTSDGLTPLHRAILNLDEKVFFELIRWHAKPCGVVNKNGDTLLHYAAKYARWDIISCLNTDVEMMFSEVSVENVESYTACDYAAQTSCTEMTNLLRVREFWQIIEKETSAELECWFKQFGIGEREMRQLFRTRFGKDDKYIWHRVCEKGDLQKANTILRYVVDPGVVNSDALDNEGKTPLHHASERGSIEMVKFLLLQCEANAQVKIKGAGLVNQGKTPKQLAKSPEVKEAFEDCERTRRELLRGLSVGPRGELSLQDAEPLLAAQEAGPLPAARGSNGSFFGRFFRRGRAIAPTASSPGPVSARKEG